MARKKSRKRFYILVSVIGIFLVLFLGIRSGILPRLVFNLIFSNEIELETAADSRTNILLLGTAGGEHEGPDLSDTIIFASIDPGKNKATLVSIPRDLWVPDIRAKINTAYAYGKSKKEGGGITLAKAAVSKVVGEPIDYVVRVDFQGFVKAVDLVGGISVDVERGFDDYQYPLAGKENDTCGKSEEDLEALATASADLLYKELPCRYKHISFEKGKQTMNGETALEFVRSRHALGAEGSDFARSKRQEKVIKAFQEKVFSLGTIGNPGKVLALYSTLQESIDTDIPTDKFDDFIKLADKMRGAKIESIVLDYGDEESGRPALLENPPLSPEYDFAWVLIPQAGNGNFSEIHKYIACSIEGTCETNTAKEPGISKRD